MKRLISFFIILLSSMVLFVGCGNKAIPEDTVKECFASIQEGKFNEIGKFMVDYSEEDTNIIDEGNEIFNDALGQIEYEILDTNIDGKSAVVKTKVIAPNMFDLTSQMMRLSVEAIIEGQDIESKEFKEKLKEDVGLDTLDTVNSEIDIKLKQEKGKWLISEGEEFLNAITGNMLEAIENFQEQTEGNE